MFSMIEDRWPTARRLLSRRRNITRDAGVFVWTSQR